MALLLLPACHFPATHLSAAQHPPPLLFHSPRAPSTTLDLSPWPAFFSSPQAGIAAAVVASTTLPRGGRRTLRRLSHPAAPDSSVADSAVAESPPEAEYSRTRLVALNIPWLCTKEDIRKLFDEHGTVVDVELSMYNKTRNRGLAFVTMASEDEALAALNNLNSYQFDDRPIKVEFARTQKKKSSPLVEEPAVRYNVFVGNLDWRVRSRDLRELFTSAHPNLLSAEVIFQSKMRRPAGYGFVSFRSKEEAEAAVSAFNGKKLLGRAIRLVFGKQQPAKSDGDPNESGELEEKSS